MSEYQFPIGPPSELQQVYLDSLPAKKRKRVPIEHDKSTTMVLIRVAYRVIQLRYNWHVRQGPPPHPLIIVEECMCLETRMQWPYIWWQIRWLGLCMANGITATQARDTGPAHAFRAQAKTLPSSLRTKW